MKYEYTFEDGSRAARKHNHSVCFLNHFDEWIKTGSRAITIQKFRLIQREEQQLPELEGKAWHGDLRASGDALGGHGLHLETVRVGNKKGVLLNKENKKKCKDYLEKGNGRAPLFID